MGEYIDIDTLLDKADAEHQRALVLKERINTPLVRSYREFFDETGQVKDRSPFYVVVHKNVIKSDQEIDEETRQMLLKEIGIIENNFDYTTAGPSQRADVPRGRPVIVCGAYDAICVRQQHDLLIKGGYDAYISREGTLPFTPNTPAFGQPTK